MDDFSSFDTAARQPGEHPAARKNRVQALRQALQSGSYAVSTAQLADCLIRHMLTHR